MTVEYEINRNGRKDPRYSLNLTAFLYDVRTALFLSTPQLPDLSPTERKNIEENREAAFKGLSGAYKKVLDTYSVNQYSKEGQASFDKARDDLARSIKILVDEGQLSEKYSTPLLDRANKGLEGMNSVFSLNNTSSLKTAITTRVNPLDGIVLTRNATEEQTLKTPKKVKCPS